MMKIAPAWVDKSLYPFQSRWIEIDEYQMHYVDEGQGSVVLMVHGTPEWSFSYRELIKSLRSSFRCIAIDHIGFGLSEKPPGEVYTCKHHSNRLNQFIQKLGLKNITIVANDFGGGIGLSYAITNRDNIRAIVLSNTWMWSLKHDKHYAGPAKIIHSLIGKFLYLKMNFPVNSIMPSAYGDKKKLTKENHRHYKMALPDTASRAGAYAFAQELMAASDWWQSLWEKADVLKSKPMLIFWGLKDKFLPAYELEKWKLKFRDAKVVTFPDAGHFIQEEEPEEMIKEIERLLK